MEKVVSILRRYLGHELTGLIILGLLLRIVLMPYFIWPYDMNEYQSSLIYFINGKDPYALHASIYPPLMYFITFPLFRLTYQFGVSFNFHSITDSLTGTNVTGLIAISQISPLFLVLWKIPVLCFDLLTGILIYYFARETTSNPKLPKYCFMLWLFNPFTLASSYLLGSYDVVVGFFILLGAFFLFKGNYFFAGISFGLGTLAKTSPIYVALPMLAILLFRKNACHKAVDLKNNLQSFLKFTVGYIVPIASFAPLFIEYVNLTWFGISREISIAGGLNQWFFASDPLRAEWINLRIGMIETIFSFYPLVVFCLAIVFSRYLVASKTKLVLMTAFFASLIYFFLPITFQPQYLLWTLPLLVVCLSLESRFIWSLIVYSVAGFLFFFSLQGFQVFLYPLAMYTSLYSPNQLVASAISYMNIPGLFSQNLTQDFSTVFGGLGFVGTLLTMALLVWSLRRVETDEK